MSHIINNTQQLNGISCKPDKTIMHFQLNKLVQMFLFLDNLNVKIT